MAIVNATPTPTRTRPKRGTDTYSTALRTRPPRRFDLYPFPGLTGLEGTGIPFIDNATAGASAQIQQAALALKISTYASVASVAISAIMLLRSLR